MTNPGPLQIPSPARVAVIVAVTSLGFFMVQLDGSILNVALAQIGAALRTGVDGLQWAADVYFLAFAILLLSAGLLSDRLGAKRAFVLGFAVFSLASLACALAFNIAALVAARALQGVGAALLVPCSLALLNNTCGDDAATRARMIGIWTAAGGVALAAGPVVGGLLVGTLGWWSIFLVNVPIGAVGIWITVAFVDDVRPTRRGGNLDLGGQVLAVLSLLGLVGAIIQAGALGWHSPVVLGGMILAVIAGGGFIMVEHRSRDPMVPLGMFRDLTFSGAALVGFVVNFTIFGLGFALGLYFQRVLLWSPVETGLGFLPYALMVTAANLVGSRLAARVGLRLPIIGGLVVTAAGFALLHGINARTTYIAMLPAQLMIRLGIGLAVPPMTAALLSTVNRHQSGIGSGILNSVRQTGGAIGVGLFGALMAADAIRGMQAALLISAILLLLAAGVAALTIHAATSGRAPGKAVSKACEVRPGAR